MVINFFIEWILFYIIIMFTMSVDNLFWIPADYNWYGNNKWREYFKPLLTIKNREYLLIPKTKEGWIIIKSRIWDVLSHPYDIIPAILTSLMLTLIF